MQRENMIPESMVPLMTTYRQQGSGGAIKSPLIPMAATDSSASSLLAVCREHSDGVDDLRLAWPAVAGRERQPGGAGPPWTQTTMTSEKVFPST